MPKIHRFFLSLLLSAALLLAAATPLAAQEAQRASGTVTAASDTGFSIRTADGDSLAFVINEDTQVEGELAAGAEVDVTYSVADGQNIATHVRVKAS